jgi:hypothetical protein
MFELNFRNERYLPFGFAGAVSRWRIELPQDNNQFDSKPSPTPCSTSTTPPGKCGEVLRRAANEVAQCKLPAAGDTVLRRGARHARALAGPAGAPPHRRRRLPTRDTALRLSRGIFPFLPGKQAIRVERIELFFEAGRAVPSDHHVVRIHEPHDDGDCPPREVHCIASADCPTLYHGTIDTGGLPSIGAHDKLGRHGLGGLELPRTVKYIENIYLLCSYTIGFARSDGR